MRSARLLRLVPLAVLLAAACGDGSTGSAPDATAPTLSLQTPTAAFLTASATATVSGTAADDREVARLTYRVNGGAETDVPITAGASVPFSFAATLAAGANTIVVAAYDRAGNRTTASVDGRLDGTAPTVSLTGPAAAAVVLTPTVELAGTASDDAGVARVTVRVNGGAETDLPITPGPTATFSVPVAVAVGASTLEVRAYDAAGNTAGAQRSVERRVAGEALLTVRDAAGAPIVDAQIQLDAAPVAADGASRQVQYGSGGQFGVEHQGGGTYRILLLPGLAYDLRIARAGQLPAVYRSVRVTPGAETFLEEVRMVPSGGAATGSPSLRVSNAFDGAALPGVALAVRAGLNTGTGPVVASGTTDAQGRHAFAGLAAGYYTVEMTRSGFSRGFVTMTVVGGTTGTFAASITPAVPAGQWRIILDWGETPSDLDSHLTGPQDTGTGRFHVYFADDVYVGPDDVTVAGLDVDDVTSYGPETITIYRPRTGRYRYSVHDFTNLSATNSTALAGSRARVRVYRGDVLVATFNVPAGRGGTLWTVFELDGTNVIPVNTMTYQSSPSAVTGRATKRPATLP